MSSNVARLENLNQILTIIKPTFEQLALVHNAVNYRQEASFAIEILQKSDYLAAAAMSNQDSFKRAIINVAAIGLTLNPAHGLAYLVPRKGKVILDVSYKGKIALAVECGAIKWCVAELVYENDEFLPGKSGDRPHHIFDPFSDNRGKIRGGYAIAKTNSDEFIVTYMSMRQIHEIRARSEAHKSGKGSPWDTDEAEMIKKTLIRRNSKSWPHASTHDRNRLDEAVKVENEVDPLPESAVLDTVKRAEQIDVIKISLITLNIDHEHYLKETLPKIIRRKIENFEELTDLEIDQIMVQMNQLVEARNIK